MNINQIKKKLMKNKKFEKEYKKKDFKSEFGQKIFEFRMKNGLTIEKMAKVLKLDPKILRRMEE